VEAALGEEGSELVERGGDFAGYAGGEEAAREEARHLDAARPVYRALLPREGFRRGGGLSLNLQTATKKILVYSQFHLEKLE
jgi:hypothetical protein